MTANELEDLQTRLAFSEATIAQLDTALVDQQNRIELLETRLAALTLQVRENASSESVEDEHEQPPHY